MKIHWKIMVWLLAGAVVGAGMQLFVDGVATSGVSVENGVGGVVVKSAPDKSKLSAGDLITELVFNREKDDERRVAVPDAKSYEKTIRDSKVGLVVWHMVRDGDDRQVTLSLDSNSDRAKWLSPFAFVADMFLRLLKMLIVPIIFFSITTGVIGIGGGKDLRRLGRKTFAYYIFTSMLAIFLGLLLVNIIRPGDGAHLGLGAIGDADQSLKELEDTSFIEVLLRMIPENVFAGFSNNRNMLQVIFFALLFGFFVMRIERKEQRTMLITLFESVFEAMMKMAQFILSLIPYGVFALLVKIIGQTGFEMFQHLGLYMLTVTLALVIHSCVTLPMILRFIGRVNPLKWMKAMSPALLTAFSTSSSSITLPVSMDTVEKRGKVSKKVVSFVQPLGATINMDGTALYECIGVIFLAQYYATTGDFDLTLGKQITVVFLALMASIGAAGIPSAGLIMMLTILTTLGLPVEGAALLLAVDRPLDMLRTVTNVWSDTCGAACVARSEGETGPLELE